MLKKTAYLTLLMTFNINASANQPNTAFEGNLRCDLTTHGYIGSTAQLKITSDSVTVNHSFMGIEETMSIHHKVVSNHNQSVISVLYSQGNTIELSAHNPELRYFKKYRVIEKETGSVEVQYTYVDIDTKLDIINMTQKFSYSCRLTR